MTAASNPAAELTEAERDIVLVPCKCGHTLNDHGDLGGCWTCNDTNDAECWATCEALMLERIGLVVAARLAAGGAVTDVGLRKPLNEAVEALLLSDAMTGDTEGTPTTYMVDAENVEYLVQTVAASLTTADLWAAAILAAADEMEGVIHDGDVAEVAAHVPGEVGRSAAVARRDALYEEPHVWLREYAVRADAAPAPTEATQGSWLCGRCGQSPEAHATSECVYDPRFAAAEEPRTEAQHCESISPGDSHACGGHRSEAQIKAEALREYADHVMAEVSVWNEDVYPNRWDYARIKARDARKHADRLSRADEEAGS